MAGLPLLRPLSFLPSPTLKPPPRKIPFLPLKKGGGSARMSGSPAATERLISIAAYSLPLVNSLQHGRYLLAQFPKLGLILEPILPFLGLYRSIPYSSFVAFFALYLGVVRNPSFPRYVRFNAMQAVTLDVLLVIPVLFHRIFSTASAGPIVVFSSNALFLFSLLCFLYALFSCLLGRTPYLPFLADAANRQI